MTIKDKLLIWIYNKNNQIEQETEIINDTVRFRPMDSLDMYEIMRRKIYVSVWQQFLDEVYKIIINCK